MKKIDFSETFLNSFQKDYYKNSWKELSEKYKISYNNISFLIKKLNLKKETKIYFLNESKIIDQYLNDHKTYNELANIYKCSTIVIRKILDKNNIQRRERGVLKRKYTLDESYFDIIDTEDKAYFLGFLYADGCNNIKDNTITLPLVEYDVEILNKFKNLINSNRKLEYKNCKKRKEIYFNQYCLTLNSKKLSNTLVQKGMLNKKSLILKFPTEEQVPSYLHNHFIRGYFDGDGCISIKNSKKGKQYMFSIVSTKEFLSSVQEVLIKNCSLSFTKLIQEKRTMKNTFCMKYGGKLQVYRIKDYLYKNSTIYLDRKRKIFDDNEIIK